MSFTEFLATCRAEPGRLTRSGQRVESCLSFDEVLRNAGAALAAPAEDLLTVAPPTTHASPLTLIKQGRPRSGIGS